ncbi:MAG: lasso RiPP family leader peptide-containing protein [Dehalococcoidia bacterium]
MSVTYEAPELRKYGSVAALTASAVKCSIGSDTAFGASNNAGKDVYLENGNGDYTGPAGTIDPNHESCERASSIVP